MGRTAVGCIGCGNMGGAILSGLTANDHYQLFGQTRTMARMEPLVARGVIPCQSAAELVEKADYIIVAVKPYQIEDVLAQVSPDAWRGKVVVSIAAGTSLATLKKATGGTCLVARCMPNTPAMVGEGVFALCVDTDCPMGDTVREEARKELLALFSALGLCLEMPESRFTAFSALIGAGPAYLFDLMEGMVLAGVTLGFGHAESRRMVEALVKGCACLSGAREDKHLLELRDNVCSPAGLTIAGVNAMNAQGLSGKLCEAILAANARGKEMEG